MSLSRRELVAAAAAGVVMPKPRPAQAAGSAGVDELEALLTLEHRLEGAYRAALERDAIDRALGESLLAHEREHVRGVEASLDALGRRRPRATVPAPAQGAAFTSRRAFARFALELETNTVAGYERVLATLAAPGLLQPLGSIMASGAQHVVALRQVAGGDLLASLDVRGGVP